MAEDDLTRLSINITYKQQRKLNKYLCFGMRSKAFNPLIDLLILTLEHPEAKRIYLSQAVSHPADLNQIIVAISLLQPIKESQNESS